jgi:hypothetical protein
MGFSHIIDNCLSGFKGRPEYSRLINVAEDAEICQASLKANHHLQAKPWNQRLMHPIQPIRQADHICVTILIARTGWLS